MKYKAVLDSKLSASQRQLLESIVQDAVVYIGKKWEEKNGQEKFSLAVQHVLDSANHYGLNLSIQDVQAAIEAAYQRSKIDSGKVSKIINIDSDKVVRAIIGPIESDIQK